MLRNTSGSFHGQIDQINPRIPPTVSVDGRISKRRLGYLPIAAFTSSPDDAQVYPTTAPASPRRSRIFPVSTENRSKFPLIMISFVIMGMTSIYVSREAVKNTAVQVHIMEQVQLRVGGKVEKAAKELNSMQREASALAKMIESDEDEVMGQANSGETSVKSFRALHKMKVLESKVTKEKAQVSHLVQRIQSTSLIEVRRKFGNDPIEVEVELQFPDGQDGPTTFVIELVPADILPHTVLTFLDMVSLGLFDGCSFILNAHHAIKAAPIPYDGSSSLAKAEAFTKAGLSGVVFKEYSDLYPHKENTVGFAVDGSPAFYINTADNQDIHDDEPCFGTITSGFDTIKRLDSMPTRNNIWFVKKVGIKWARIIEKGRFR